jgi:hypothetical protein
LQAEAFALRIVSRCYFLGQIVCGLAPPGRLSCLAFTACKPKGACERESYGLHSTFHSGVEVSPTLSLRACV